MNENEQADNIRREQRQQNYNGNKNDKQYNQFQSQNQKYSHNSKNQNENYNQKKGDFQNNRKNQQNVNQIIKEKQDLRFDEAQQVIDIYFLQNSEKKQSIVNILNEDENQTLNNNNKNQEYSKFKTQRVIYNNTGKQYATICRMIQKNHSKVFNKLELQNQQIENNFRLSNQNQGQNIGKEPNNIDINVAQQHYQEIIYQTQIIFKTLKFVCTSPFRKVNMMEAQSAIRSLIPKLLFLLRQIGIDRENLQKLKQEINEQIIKEKEEKENELKISEKFEQQQQLQKQNELLISRLIQKLLENLKMKENQQFKNFLEQLMSFEQGYPQLIIWLSNLNYFDKFCYENLFILTNEFDYFLYVRKTQRQKVDKQQIRAFRFLPILWGVKKLDAGYLNDKFQEQQQMGEAFGEYNIQQEKFYQNLLQLMNLDLPVFKLNNLVQYLWILSFFPDIDVESQQNCINKFIQEKNEADFFVFNLKNSYILCQVFISYFPEICAELMREIKGMEIDVNSKKNNQQEQLVQKLKEQLFESKNPFAKYFEDFYQIFLKAYSVLQVKNDFNKSEYITIKDMKNQESIVYYNQKLRFNSKFETWVEKILQIMEDVKAKRNNILGFYEIDYILNDEIILETNGGYHFVSSTYNGEKRRFINNYKQKIQHLEYLGYDKVIFINYFDWEMYDNKEEKKINYLRTELQRLSQKK